MHTIIKIGLWLLAVGLVSSAQAVSFDCNKAASEVEKMLCADQTLSDLDSALAATYNQAIFRSTSAADFKTRQLAWLNDVRNVCLTADCVELAYRQRLADLNAIPVMYASVKEAIDGTCREMAAVNSAEVPGLCQLIDSGSFGAIGDSAFHYARYCTDWMSPTEVTSDCFITSIALFEEQKNKGPTQRFYEYSIDIGGHISTPVIDTNEYGVVLTMSVGISGTGAFNDNQYFIRRKSRWVHMNTQSWLVDLNQRIPSNVEIIKGVEPNLSTLAAQAWLYQHGEASCCPTGGTAVIDLGIAGNLLFIKDMHIEPYKADE